MFEIQSESVPKGFTIIPDKEKESIYILHHRTGMYVMNGFLIIWLVFWTGGCVWLLRGYIQGLTVEGAERMPFLFLSFFWAAEIFVACWLIYCFFGKRLYILTPQELVVEVSVFRFRRVKVIPSVSIKLFRQVKDGGEDEDSFPSWGLTVEADKKTTLLYRQRYEKSHWLGQTLAAWAGVDFIEVPKD
jgi:hypothetical protein